MAAGECPELHMSLQRCQGRPVIPSSQGMSVFGVYVLNGIFAMISRKMKNEYTSLSIRPKVFMFSMEWCLHHMKHFLRWKQHSHCGDTRKDSHIASYATLYEQSDPFRSTRVRYFYSDGDTFSGNRTKKYSSYRVRI
jgi:hypothetical protein